MSKPHVDAKTWARINKIVENFSKYYPEDSKKIIKYIVNCDENFITWGMNNLDVQFIDLFDWENFEEGYSYWDDKHSVVPEI